MTRRTATERDALSARLLTRDELPLVWTIDRREIIHHLYALRDGELQLVPDFYDVRGWPDGEAEHYTPILLDCHDRGGWCLGMFDGARLVAAVIVDADPLGPRRDMLQLKFLHVSQDWRGCGLGEHLYRAARAQARTMGAARLYVSATPSQRTIDFYLRLGFTVSASPDPALYALEPEDIHLEAPTA
ncbi:MULTISPECIES: GNAT family N-acetyltransferase [unclassified Burkholderia]|uniref:GNAT family N-acetyltransferase n=1 Tax=unclassified Burkholderia TaxID=2613784 RepID=UPI000F55EA0E|nr:MULTISPECIES: GNAT family N-acetyltransferase [unclassified Burkholderia]RQS00898.1 N-acetyltransferase [Burkholderia sp. Bp8994]RQS33197.1 N-acetyltransferase [Burkholderia sp. Bp8995]RQS41639.1 N-acetyltransferase [Burkholderia sp. Bp8990]RQS50592.1 N-acetyltransferase [Burkholderia sp. Bp8989]RQS62656.1 N-acetyltransferase [Burkholderia sp. Bp8984]